MNAVRIDRHERGPRVYLAGLRIHHGTAGIVAILTFPLTRRRAILLAGIVALAHDRKDFPFRDTDNH